MGLNVSARMSKDNKEVTIEVRGRFDFSLHEEFRNIYSSVVEPSLQVVVDLQHVESLDSSALGMLLMLREQAGQDLAKVKLVKACREIRNILKVSNFEKLFEIE